MLSIIVSSYQPENFSALEKNIAETCGVDYELIKIDNPGIMGIPKAYNKGAKKARFENLLFLHEDVLFHTQNWGENVAGVLSILSILAKATIGIVIFMWIRWTIPRFRYDQLMHLGWKTLIPLALLNLVLTGAVILFFAN